MTAAAVPSTRNALTCHFEVSTVLPLFLCCPTTTTTTLGWSAQMRNRWRSICTIYSPIYTRLRSVCTQCCCCSAFCALSMVLSWLITVSRRIAPSPSTRVCREDCLGKEKMAELTDSRLFFSSLLQCTFDFFDVCHQWSVWVSVCVQR